jgi:dihydroorotase-like cyclic amidohydrolase
MVDMVAGEFKGRIHIPHISKQEELEAVMEARRDPSILGKITNGVCGHHLYLTDEDPSRLGWFARMKPTLGTARDRDFLRDNVNEIDVFETDHAPHPLADKERCDAENPTGETGTGKPTCFGVPGEETHLPLLIRGVHEGWLTIDQVIEKAVQKPAEILRIVPPDSRVVFDATPRVFTREDVVSKCGWSAFEGMEVGGRVESVVLGGITKVLGGRVVAARGSGRVITPLMDGAK